MRKHLAVSVLLASVALLGGNAQAADAVADYTHDWTGFYAGVHAGFGNANISGVYDSPDADPGDVFVDDGEGSFDLEPKDFLLGAQLGYNHQIDNFVLGVEADLAWADWSDSLKYGSDDDELSAEMNWLGTIRARAGVTMGELLLFGTAGVAWSDTSFTGNDDYPDTDPGEVGTADFSDMGWAFGGGAEYAITESVSIKADALYIMFDEQIDTADLQSEETKPGDYVELEDMFVARVGINYHF